MDMTFPENLDDFRIVASKDEAENLIRLENATLSSKIEYRWMIQKGRYLYGRCRYRRCRAYLTFKKI